MWQQLWLRFGHQKKRLFVVDLCTVWVCTAPCVHVWPYVCVNICVNTYYFFFLFFKTTNGIVVMLADFSSHGTSWPEANQQWKWQSCLRRAFLNNLRGFLIFLLIGSSPGLFSESVWKGNTELWMGRPPLQAADTTSKTKRRNFMFAGREKWCHLVKQKLCHAAGRSIS